MPEVAQLKRTETAMAALAAQVQSPHLQSRPRWLPGVLQTDYLSANSMVDVILRQTAHTLVGLDLRFLNDVWRYVTGALAIVGIAAHHQLYYPYFHLSSCSYL